MCYISVTLNPFPCACDFDGNEGDFDDGEMFSVSSNARSVVARVLVAQGPTGTPRGVRTVQLIF